MKVSTVTYHLCIIRSMTTYTYTWLPCTQLQVGACAMSWNIFKRKVKVHLTPLFEAGANPNSKTRNVVALVA